MLLFPPRSRASVAGPELVVAPAASDRVHTSLVAAPGIPDRMHTFPAAVVLVDRETVVLG